MSGKNKIGIVACYLLSGLVRMAKVVACFAPSSLQQVFSLLNKQLAGCVRGVIFVSVSPVLFTE